MLKKIPIFTKARSCHLCRFFHVSADTGKKFHAPPLFSRLCWCGKKFDASEFCKRNFGHDFLSFRENLEGLPVLELPKTPPKVFYWVDVLLKKIPLIVSIVLFTQFRWPCAHRSICSHTLYLLPLVSFALWCSNSGCYSMAQEVVRSSPAEIEEVIWFFAHSCQSITAIKNF